MLSKISRDDAQKSTYANKNACRSCPYKTKCFKQGGKHDYRRLNKDEHFKTLYKADCIFEANKELYHTRQELSEHIFGSIKRQLGFPQLNVRTKVKVEGEVSLLFLGYNFKRVMKIIGRTELIRYFHEHASSVFHQIKFMLLKLRFKKLKIHI